MHLLCVFIKRIRLLWTLVLIVSKKVIVHFSGTLRVELVAALFGSRFRSSYICIYANASKVHIIVPNKITKLRVS